MPRLPFVALDAYDEGDIVDVVVPLMPSRRAQRPLAAKHRGAPAGGEQRPSAAVRQPDDGPVRDTDGWTVHRIRVASRQEMTCLVCGETNTDGVCWTCGKGYDPANTPMVPTISYLQPEEYELIRKG